MIIYAQKVFNRNMANRKLNQWQKADADRLAAMFKSFKSKTGRSQEKIAQEFGMTQGAISQYIRGRIPLNIEALLDFAHVFKCDVSDISPTLSKKLYRWVDDATSKSLMVVEDSLQVQDFNLLSRGEIHALEEMARHLIKAKKENPTPGAPHSPLFRPRIVKE